MRAREGVEEQNESEGMASLEMGSTRGPLSNPAARRIPHQAKPVGLTCYGAGAVVAGGPAAANS